MTHDPLDTAWRIHGTVLDWTARAETKASFALTLQSAVIAGVVALTAPGRRFGDFNDSSVLALYVFGLGALFIAVFYSAWAVLPQLRREAVEGEAPSNFIYFGHLMHRKGAELEQALRDEDPLPALSKQLIVISKIAWSKHYRVSMSMLIGGLGDFLLVLAFFLAETPT